MSSTTTRLRLRVSPGAGRTEVVGRYGEGWKVRVNARAERGRANEAVLSLLAETLGVPRARLVLLGGASSPDKIVGLEGVGPCAADDRMSAAARGEDG